MRTIVLVSTLVLAALVTAPDAALTQLPGTTEHTGPGDRYEGPAFAARSPSIAMNGMAATSHPIATQVALDILKEGGNAIDAAIAANAVIGFLEPTGNGIGGDLFVIYWSAEDRQLYGLNASGRSPMGLTREQLIAEMDTDATRIPLRSGLAVSVPGTVDGWWEMHRRHGRLAWERVLEPAVRYAEEGAPVPTYIANLWTRSENLADMPGFADVFLPEGRAPAVGEVFRNPALSNTLRIIARDGGRAYYEGDLAREFARFCREEGGCHITEEDLAAHRSEWVDPVPVSYRGYEFWQLPPNTQGVAGSVMLALLDGFDLEGMGHNSAEYLHHLIEAKKIAFEDVGRYYADPEFSGIDPLAFLDPERIARQRARIDPTRAADRFPPDDPRLNQPQTINLSVGDAEGNLVSLIQSNYTGFGSGLAIPQLGFGLQNRGGLFALDPEHPNVYEPGKRPFHTIIPGFVTKDGAPYMAFGVMGGDMQPQGHVQVFLNHVLFGMDAQVMGDAARFRHAGSTDARGDAEMTDGGCVQLESVIGDEVRRALEAKGHTLCRNQAVHYGGYQNVMIHPETGALWGGTETRTDGVAAGW
jgi:gamma-glutamyltranspeptidase / glutathione hydrolase